MYIYIYIYIFFFYIVKILDRMKRLHQNKIKINNIYIYIKKILNIKYVILFIKYYLIILYY